MICHSYTLKDAEFQDEIQQWREDYYDMIQLK